LKNLKGIIIWNGKYTSLTNKQKNSNAMDMSLALVPYLPHQQLSPDNWAALAALLLFIGGCLQAVPKTVGQSNPEEVQVIEEPDSSTRNTDLSLVVFHPARLPTTSVTEKPVVKKEPRVEIPGLEDSILATLSKRTGLRTKDLVPKIRTIFPGIKKGDINSCLYKLLTKKQVLKSNDDTPLWTLKK
jgi:hypothetical protein